MWIYLAVWSLVALVLALWSVTVWSLQAVGAWAMGSAPAVADAATGMGGLKVPAEWAEWLPPVLAEPLNQAVLGLLPLADSLLRLAPEFSGGLAVAAWGLWSLGAVVIVGLGLLAHLLLALWRRHRARAQTGIPAARTAA